MNLIRALISLRDYYLFSKFINRSWQFSYAKYFAAGGLPRTEYTRWVFKPPKTPFPALPNTKLLKGKGWSNKFKLLHHNFSNIKRRHIKSVSKSQTSSIFIGNMPVASTLKICNFPSGKFRIFLQPGKALKFISRIINLTNPPIMMNNLNKSVK